MYDSKAHGIVNVYFGHQFKCGYCYSFVTLSGLYGHVRECFEGKIEERRQFNSHKRRVYRTSQKENCSLSDAEKIVQIKIQAAAVAAKKKASRCVPVCNDGKDSVVAEAITCSVKKKVSSVPVSTVGMDSEGDVFSTCSVANSHSLEKNSTVKRRILKCDPQASSKPLNVQFKELENILDGDHICFRPH